MKLNSDEQTLLENKVLILYIIDKVGKAIYQNALIELILEVSDMNYFYLQQFLLDLQEDKLVVKYDNPEDTIYEITNEGKSALELTKDMIPGIVKLKVDSKFKDSLDNIEEKFSISADFTPKGEKDFMVKCKIIENTNVLFELNTFAGSREQAKKIVDNWNINAENIYPKILELLVDNTQQKTDI